MNKIDTSIIKKDYLLIRNRVASSYVVSTVFPPNENLLSTFDATLLINNKSNTFVKHTSFIYDDKNNNENNVDILNVNQSKINGLFIDISNLSNTFIVNLNNSLSTFDCDLLSTASLINSRNEDQSFFNFPVPSDTKDFLVQPMMISNGLRTIWSEGKYGWINTEKISSLQHFLNYCPHDLNGQTITINLTSLETLLNITNYHNGVINIIGTNANTDLTIKNCGIKLNLSGFLFNKLNIINCNVVYLEDCNFSTQDTILSTISEINSSLNPLQFKQGELNNVQNYCLSSSNSKIFIKNDINNLIFSNFFIGIIADNNSQIYMIPENDNVGILLREDLSDFVYIGDSSINPSIRPIFLLAKNGSMINCGYYQFKNGQYINNISTYIKYPNHKDEYYKPETEEEFIVTNEEMYNVYNKNYYRMKSLLIAMFSLINNSSVNISFNRNSDTIVQTLSCSIPIFGLYQAAKPKMNEANSLWQLANNSYHYLSGTENNHISAEGNNLYTLNTYRNDKLVSDCRFFPNYNVYLNSSISGYGSAQPHLAHYFINNGALYNANTVLMVCSNINRNTTAKGAIDITKMKLYLDVYKLKE